MSDLHQAAHDPYPRRQPRDRWKFLRTVYHRYLYRAHMRFAHRFSWHHTKSTVMQDGVVNTRCEWCGLQQVCSYDLAELQGFVPKRAATLERERTKTLGGGA